MTDTKLTDFTVDQLQHVLDEIVAGILRLEKFDAVKYYLKYGETVAYDSEGYRTMVRFQNLCLWRTQILNAISTVQRREQITNS